MRRFWRDETGSIGLTFPLMVVPLTMLVGVTVDYADLAGKRSFLQSVQDSAILATNNGGSLTQPTAQGAVKSYMNAHIEASSHRFDNITTKVSLSDDQRTVTAVTNAEVNSSFLGMIGRSKNTITVTSRTERGMDNIVELALVLDTTGSMAASNKMTTLKSSARLLVDTLTTDPKNDVSIALVPFAQYVNVGTGNRGASWMTSTQDYTTTTNVPASCTTRRDVVSQTNCRNVTVTSNNDGVITTRIQRQCDNVMGPPYQVCTPASTRTNTFRWTGCVGSRPQPNHVTDANGAIPYPALFNTNCGTAIVPLNKNYSSLKTTIDNLNPSGETYGPAGLIWGWNVLSPAAPFTQAKAYDPDRRKPRKVMVFMTDGVNTRSMNSPTATTHTGSNRADADAATTALCSNVKDAGIEMFVIALMVDDLATQNMLRSCSSSTKHYFNASDTQLLKDAFEQIARSLQVPRLTQ
jgi:Flp pilus assembly protein TadG